METLLGMSELAPQSVAHSPFTIHHSPLPIAQKRPFLHKQGFFTFSVYLCRHYYSYENYRSHQAGKGHIGVV